MALYNGTRDVCEVQSIHHSVTQAHKNNLRLNALNYSAHLLVVPNQTCYINMSVSEVLRI